MNKKAPCVKTKRLIIMPMSDEEIEKLIETAGSEELRAAYIEMLAGCQADPANRIWYAPWKMTLKDDDTYIGDLGFKGTVKDSAVEIGYGILPEYEGNGYTTEAVQAMTQWAFASADIVFIEAETDPKNRASQRVLEKCGFKPDGDGKEGPRFVLEKALPSWTAIYMLFGISIGTALGSTTGNSATCYALGIAIGLCLGTALDSGAKKDRKRLLEQRENQRDNRGQK